MDCSHDSECVFVCVCVTVCVWNEERIWLRIWKKIVTFQKKMECVRVRVYL